MRWRGLARCCPEPGAGGRAVGPSNGLAADAKSLTVPDVCCLSVERS